MIVTAEALLPIELPELPDGHVPINESMWYEESGGFCVVLHHGIPIYRFDREDTVTLRFVAAALRLGRHATQEEIAAAFGHSVRSQMRWEQHYREEGLSGLDDRPRTGRPRGVGSPERVFLTQGFGDGVGNREIARRLGVGEATVRRELKRLGLSRPPAAGTREIFEETFEPQEQEDEEGEAAPEEEGKCGDKAAVVAPAFSLDVDPLCRMFDRELARQGVLDDAAPLFADAEELPRAGVLLAIPLFAASGVLDVFEKIYRSIGPAFYGLRSTVVCLFLMALLRIRRPENLKEVRPEDLGRIMGLDRMPEVKTLRRKLRRLAESGKGEELMRALAELRIEEDSERLGFLYVDGHVREYHGRHPLGKAHVTAKRISAPAETDTWVNDARGDPLFVVTGELNAGLTKTLPAVLTEVRGLVGKEQRVTVVFDRGGYSPGLFAKLKASGFDLITYRKGAQDPVALAEFEEIRIDRGGEPKVWKIHDKQGVAIGTKKRATGTKNAAPWLRMRQVSRLKDDGVSVTQVLTTRTDLSAAEVLIRMFSRWRQENFFKYMKAEFALDALVEYGAEELPEKVDRPNPERRDLEKRRSRLKVRLGKLLAELGEEVEGNDETRRRTVRGFKIANAEIRRRIEQATAEMEALTSRISDLPKRVSAEGLRRLKRDRKLVVDAIKMVAYQQESDLHRRLFGKYARADEEGRALLRAIFQSPARIEVGKEQLTVTIARQSSDHRTEVLRQMCDELNALEVRFPGSDLRLALAAEPLKPVPEHATDFGV